MDAYTTIFVVGDTTAALWLPIPFIAGLLVGAIILRHRRIAFATRLIGWGAVLLGLLGPVLLIASYVSLISYKRALTSHEYRVVEGRVGEFHPMPRGGHVNEEFEVNGVWFSYSTFGPTHCFSHTTSYGGPIRKGLYVRIAYIDNCILRLDVRP
jgi:hypothetical protein